MNTSLIRPELITSAEGPFLAAAELTQADSRTVTVVVHNYR